MLVLLILNLGIWAYDTWGMYLGRHRKVEGLPTSIESPRKGERAIVTPLAQPRGSAPEGRHPTYDRAVPEDRANGSSADG